MPDFQAGSEVTLINVDPITELVLAKESVTNTTLLRHNKPCLKVSTNGKDGAITTITDVQTNQLLVTIKRRDFRSDIISFTNLYGGKPVKVKDWIQEKKPTNQRSQWKINTTAGSFTWRTDVVLRLTLCSENDLDHPIAWVQPKTETKRYALVMKGGTENFRDEIVASYIILEQRMRMKEKQNISRVLVDSNPMTFHQASW